MSFWTIDATGQTWLRMPDFDPANNDVGLASAPSEPLSDEYELIDTPHGKIHVNVVRSIIKHVLRDGGTWEPHITKLLEQYVVPGSTAIDVGANIGTHTLTMARMVGQAGRVYAFEPQAKMYGELRANVAANGLDKTVVPVRAAIGSGQSAEPLYPALDEAKACVGSAIESYVPGASQTTLRPCHDEGGVSVGPGTELVETVSLDSLGFRNVSLVKIDVEGGENAVLDGAAETLRREQPVVIIEIMGGFEFGTATKHRRADIYRTIRKLEDIDYQVIQLEKWDYLAFPIQ